VPTGPSLSGGLLDHGGFRDSGSRIVRVGDCDQLRVHFVKRKYHADLVF
jgi:hypothetical protein